MRKTGLSEGTIKNALQYLRRAFSFAVESEYLLRNPCRHIHVEGLPIEEQRKKLEEVVLSDEEVVRLLDAASMPYTIEKTRVVDGKKKTTRLEEHPPRYLRPFIQAALATVPGRGSCSGRGIGIRRLVRRSSVLAFDGEMCIGPPSRCRT